MYRAMASHPRAGSIDFSSLRYCNSGGAPLPAELKEEWQKLTGVELLEGWGMTETSPAGTVNVPNKPRIASAGVPLPAIVIEIRDLDDPHRRMPPGERGEMCIKGPNVFSAYYKQPLATEEAFIDGFFRTGDIGYFDEEGFLYIVDRKKDMILVSGFNVYPNEIEDTVMKCPGVAEVAAIGVPDEHSGEVVKLFVVRKDPNLAKTLPATSARR
jgi:long-chain acyl-CoA synthetase